MGLRAFSAPVRAPGQFWVEGGLTSTLAGARSYILFGRSENPQFDGARCWNTLLAKQDRGGYICKLQEMFIAIRQDFAENAQIFSSFTNCVANFMRHSTKLARKSFHWIFIHAKFSSKTLSAKCCPKSGTQHLLSCSWMYLVLWKYDML